jgi:endoglycosylceramidase
MTAELDRLTARRGALTDTAGRHVVLRGFVTITADHRGPVTLDETNFDQIASYGFNVQQIRLEGARLGVLETERDPSYLDKLDQWVTWGAERGLYTIFKMTTYDVPSIGGPGNAFNRDLWQAFWDRDDYRSDRIEAWRPVWERFAGRTEVVGYDLLNEPFVGNDTPDITRRHLYPFYEAAAAELRGVDDDVCLVVQPISGGQWAGIEAVTPHGEQVAIADHNVVYAPHFYPDLTKTLTRSEYEKEMQGCIEEAAQVGGALLVGEFGNPNAPLLPAFRTCVPAEERIKGDVFDRYGVGCVRPWYIDDGYWAVFGPGFAETDRLAAVVRPFPQRVPSAATWSFDDDAGRLEVVIDGAGAKADTVLAVPCTRFYPQGFKVAVNGNDVEVTSTDTTVTVPASSIGRGAATVVVDPA